MRMAADEVVLRRRAFVAIRAALVEPVEYLRATAIQDRCALRRDVEREELPVVRLRTEPGPVFDHRFLRCDLHDRANGILPRAFARHCERLGEMAAHTVDKMIADASHQIDVLEVLRGDDD